MNTLLWISMLLFLLTGRGSLSEGKPPIKLNAILGEKITFTYQLPDEFKIGDIFWYFNNTVITTVKLGEHISSRKPEFEGRLDDIHQNGSLQIINLTMKDRGSYKAEVSNAQDGTDQKIYEYELKIFTRVSKPNITVTVDIVNKTCYITLSCTAEEGGDHVNYTWSGENIKPSVGSILDLSRTNPNTNLKIYCTAANPASHMSASVKPWKSCPKEFQKDTGGANTGQIGGIVSAVIIACVVVCFAVACRKKRKKMEGSAVEGQTTYSQINSPSNTTQGNNHYTRSEETKHVTTVYATVNTRKRESPAINERAPEENTERTMYTVVQTPKNGAPAAIISAMDEKTVYSEVQQPKNKSDNTILYETVSNEPSQATSYNEVI